MQIRTDSQVVLRASALFKRFGRISAVNNLSLEVRSSECLGLLGPNGAGKSTTLSLLAGLQTPDMGSITVLGRRDPSEPAVRRALGLVPQEIALYPDLTVRENLYFFARLQGLHGARLRSRADIALRFAALTGRAASLVRTLSGGMQRRLNLVCASLHNPQLLLLDEPTVGVDQQSRAHLFECIRQLKREGVAIVYSTHYMDEVEELCDRVAIVDNGEIIAEGTPQELLSRHGGSTILRARATRSSAAVAQLAPFISADGWMRVPCTDVRAELDRLLASGVELGEVHIERARLEDVVLAITGRRLRDG